MKYDFVLFENYYLAINHYKDVGIIAKMLYKCNYSVAIADVYEEEEYCSDIGITHISSPFKYTKKLRIFGKLSLKEGLINKWHVFWYYVSLYRFVKYLKGKCKGVYAGSYYSSMPIWWLYFLPEGIDVFFWGLRSSRLIEYKYAPFTLSGFNSFFLRRIVDKKKNVKFFVSDKLIKDEFIALGIEERRLVIRPERIIDKLCVSEMKTQIDKIQLLTFGTIRKQKRIELCIEAIKHINNDNILYIIAGKTADTDYENVIEKHSKNVNFVKRLNYRIPEEEYNALLDDADFFVLCDEQQLSTVTNGTMNEALLKGIPIIAPNYNPYKYYIEKYGIGLLYNPANIESLSVTIEKALIMGKHSFTDKIANYQNTLLSSNVIKKFGEDIAATINN